MRERSDTLLNIMGIRYMEAPAGLSLDERIEEVSKVGPVVVSLDPIVSDREAALLLNM